MELKDIEIEVNMKGQGLNKKNYLVNPTIEPEGFSNEKQENNNFNQVGPELGDNIPKMLSQSKLRFGDAYAHEYVQSKTRLSKINKPNSDGTEHNMETFTLNPTQTDTNKNLVDIKDTQKKPTVDGQKYSGKEKEYGLGDHP